MSIAALKEEPPLKPATQVLVFSTRERIRDILTVGLMQCHFSVTHATNSNIASLKANQFVPDLVIADITENNTKDILIVNRLRSSERTKNTPLLAIVPRALKDKLQKIIFAKNDGTVTAASFSENTHFSLIEYPFSLSDLLKTIRDILIKQGKSLPQKQKKAEALDDASSRIGDRLLDMTIPVDVKLKEISQVLNKQWVFPYTVIKALDIIGSDTSCCNELAKCIQSDLSASAAILKVANTVHFAKRQQRITEIKEAVVRLGFAQTRNLLSCFALIDLTEATYGQSGFTRMEFWLHSLAVALIASRLCEDCGFRRPELAFVAGLIHDLGKIPLDNNFKKIFPWLLEETVSRIEPFYKTEKKFMNFSHAELGHFLTSMWNFPSSISLAILNHHNPDRILQTTPVIDRIIHESVFIANQIAKAMNLGHSCDEIVEQIPGQMLRDLAITRGISDRFIIGIIRSLNQMGQYLNIGIKKMTLAQPSINQPEGNILFVHGDHSDLHPLVIALRHCGYIVHVAKQLPSPLDPAIRVIISLPDPGASLDIVLYDDDQKVAPEVSPLKIFIIDVEPEHEQVKGYSDSTMIFISKNHLDIRLILHTLDKYFGKVIEPQITDVDVEQECTKSDPK